MPDIRRESTLHLLFLSGDQAAIHTAVIDQPTYYGSNVAEAAARDGVPGRPLRRVFFDYQGEVDGVRKAESVWLMDALPGTAPHLKPISELTEQQQGWVQVARTPITNVPWMQAGWFAQALAWVDAELNAQGWRRQGDPVDLKHWQISALWRVNTTHGTLYFKAVPDFFHREVQLTPRLARELTGAAPDVIAADLERGFLLLADAGEAVNENLSDFVPLMGHLAQLQRDSLPLISGWNLRDRGPEFVLKWLDNLLSDEGLLIGQKEGFTDEEAQQLRAARPRLESALQRLARSPLPRTLGHGDLHGGNVVVKDGKFTVLDWSDVCMTHPFMDVNPAYFVPNPWENSLNTDQTQMNAARSAYLQAWTDYAPLKELESLFKDGELTGELFRALGYVDGIYDAVQDKTEWHGTHLIHLRKALQLLAEA